MQDSIINSKPHELCHRSGTKKWKLALLLTLLFLSVSGYATERVLYAQNLNISLNVSNVSMKKVIEMIETSDGYVFIYNDEVKTSLKKKISIQTEDSSIDDLLTMMLDGTGIAYKRSNRQITLYLKESGDIIENSSPQSVQQSSERTVRGKVIDDNMEPLLGVSVVVKGRNEVILTDFEGNYQVMDVSRDDEITFSSIGMLTYSTTVGDRTVINVTMQPEVYNLSGAVVVGYGSQRRESLTGSMAIVKDKDLVKTPQISASNMLTGRVPGLITTQTYGVPGSDNANLSIRGFGDALFIVDGVERDARFIDPNTIESVTILKDAASSIYGSRAGNGVVLITTKRGRSSKPTITLSSTLTLQSVTAMPKTVSSGQYVELKREEFYNKNGKETILPPPYTEEQMKKYYEGGDPQYPNTNWYDLIIRDGAPMQQHSISLRGGNDNVSYYSYLGYTKQESIFSTNFGYYQRYTFQTNLDAKITDRIKLETSFSYNYHDRNYPARSAYSGDNSIWQTFWFTLPIYPASLPNPDYLAYAGGATGGIHLISDRDITGYNRSRVYTTSISGALTYDFNYVEGLYFKAFVDYNKSDYPTKIFHKPIDFYTYNYSNDEYSLQGSYYTQAALEQTQGYGMTFTTQFSLNYERLFNNKHRVKALGLFETIDIQSDELKASRRNFITGSIDQMFAGSTDTATNDGSASENGRASWVGRFNYSFADKYLLELILRADASAKFAPGHRWGWFPGVMAGWRIEQEPFMRNANFDILKLKLSYGQMGNDAIGNFQYLSGYKIYEMTYLLGNSSVNGLKSAGMANPNMTWEKMAISNAGIEFSWNKHLVYGSFDIFYRERNGILGRRNASLPTSFGATLPLENINSQNTRGWEVELGSTRRFGDFTYDVKANLSWSRSKWMHYEEADYTDPDQIRLNKLSGQWVDRQIGYISNGLFTSQEQIDNLDYTYPGGNAVLRPGDLIIVDRNGDKVIDWRDQDIIGMGIVPHYMLGFDISLRYKDFDLSILFQGAFGFYKKLVFSGGENYYSIVYEERWHEGNNNPNALVPRLSGAPTNDYTTRNNFVKSDYLRLKTLNFGYNIPRSILSKINVASARLSLSAYNILTFSALNKYHFDPEAPSGETGRSYPLNKTVAFGLDVSF